MLHERAIPRDQVFVEIPPWLDPLRRPWIGLGQNPLPHWLGFEWPGAIRIRHVIGVELGKGDGVFAVASVHLPVGATLIGEVVAQKTENVKPLPRELFLQDLEARILRCVAS